jgi:hypothetical protein
MTEPDPTTVWADRIRRAYELGRVRTALLSASLVTALVATLAVVAGEAQMLAWLPVTFAAWSWLFWRGGDWLAGGRLGVLAGAVTLVLPMSILRPCCKPGMDMATMGADCCTRPELCGVSGVVLGLLLAVSLPMRGGSLAKTALGASLGVVAVASMRCSALFVGEALGLLGGLAAGIAVASVARGVWRGSSATR